MIRKTVAGKCCDGVVSKEKSCCKTCYNCPNCFNITFDRISDLIYAIEHTLSVQSEAYLCDKAWGFSRPSLPNKSKKVLTLYRDTLLRYKKSLINNFGVCLCDDEAQSVIEEILNLVDLSCTQDRNRCDLITDDSNLDTWLINHPGCVAFEDWEERFYWVIPKLGIEVKEVSDAYKLLYALNVSEIEDTYKVLYNLTVISKAVNEGCYDVNVDVTKVNCGLDYSLYIKDFEKCKIEFNALIKELECNINLSPEVKKVVCGIDFSTYAKLLECNISTEIIASFLNCGIGVSYNAEHKCGELIVGNKVILLDEGFNVDILGEDVDMSLLESFTGRACYLDTPLDLSEHGYSS